MTPYQKAQLAYDHAAPDDSPAALEVTEVSNWIDGAADLLLAGKDVMLGGRILVEAYELSNQVAAYVVNGKDEDGNLGQLILAALDFSPALAASNARALFGADRDWPRQAAVDLITPFADAILEQLIEDNRND